MDARLTNPTPDRLEEFYIPINGKYKVAIKVTSKELRQELLGEDENKIENFKIGLAYDSIERMLIKIRKLRCVRAKNLALRLLHGDIFTNAKLLKLGLTDSDECSKCRQRETLQHLIKDCWYSGIIWSRIHELYKKTDTRTQNYDKLSLDFPTGALLSVPKLKLHLEVIRRICSKDRPNILPRMLIQQALDYLITCDPTHQTYFQKLKNALNANQNQA